MAMALQLLEDSACPSCGMPTWVCRGVENMDRFEVGEDICHATATADEYRSEVEGSTGRYSQGIPHSITLSMRDTRATPTEAP